MQGQCSGHKTRVPCGGGTSAGELHPSGGPVDMLEWDISWSVIDVAGPNPLQMEPLLGRWSQLPKKTS